MLTIPAGRAIANPMISPSRTETFDQKPLKNRLISTIETSTRKAMVR